MSPIYAIATVVWIASFCLLLRAGVPGLIAFSWANVAISIVFVIVTIINMARL